MTARTADTLEPWSFPRIARLGLSSILAVAAMAQVARVTLARPAADDVSNVPQSSLAASSPDIEVGLSRQAYERDDFARAATSARRAIRLSPLNSDAVGLLAISETNLGKGEPEMLMSQLPRLGWRNIEGQYVLATSDAERGTWDDFMLRADALLRQGYGFETFAPLLRRLASYKAPRAALVSRLTLQPGWRAPYLLNLKDVDSSTQQGQADVLADLARMSSPPTSAEKNAFVQYLLDAQSYAMLRAVLGGSVRSGQNYADGAIKAASEAGPFDWRLQELPGVRVATTTDYISKTSALQVVVDPGSQGALLSKNIILPAGTYRLTAQVRSAQPISKNLIFWQIVCKAHEETLGSTTTGTKQDLQALETSTTFVVGEDCPLQTVTAYVGSKGSASQDVVIDDISISSVAHPT